GAARRTTARPCLAAPTPGHVVNSRCVKVQVATTDRASATPFAPVGQTRDGDVYVNEPKRLKEGEEKHVISVFVADEAGIINRVAGVCKHRVSCRWPDTGQGTVHHCGDGNSQHHCEFSMRSYPAAATSTLTTHYVNSPPCVGRADKQTRPLTLTPAGIA
ncbi:acetolactate synthase, partial [Haematococcus lacustris]